MENKLIYRINNGSIFMRSSRAAVNAHEEALSRLRRGQPLICRMGRRAWPHRDHYLIWYGIDNGMAVVSPMDLRNDGLRRVPVSDVMMYVKNYWAVDVEG